MSRRARRRHADPARKLAHSVLLAVETRDAYANLLLADHLAASGLSGRDAAFATALVNGTARGLGTWDAIIAAASGRDPARLQPAVRTVLRMACQQLLAMRVPTRAAVASSVELAGEVVGERVTGLVNAVSRRIARHDLAGWTEELSKGDELSDLALSSLHPRWIVEAFVDLLGAEEAARALAADNDPAPVTLVARPGLCQVAELVAEGAEPTSASPWGAVVTGDPSRIPAVAQGRAGVQDEGSQLVTLALTRAAGHDRPWLDVCAGPGGKAALLAACAAGRGTALCAAELHPHRARLVARALEPIKGAHEVVVADATRPPWRPAAFDAVMADVPCTGLGALRRRPEARWRRHPEDVDALAPLQLDILTRSMELAAPGAVIAYVTCSPHRRETTEVIEAALASLPVEEVDTPALLPEVTDASTGPRGRQLQLWPHRHGTDAMFCALLRRRAEG